MENAEKKIKDMDEKRRRGGKVDATPSGEEPVVQPVQGTVTEVAQL